ncbi:MAG: hypothetical protein FWD43_02140, partial [Coriobacteriia bacterium]|nr:hypothetical protein [Coriobacteriia bacterium]
MELSNSVWELAFILALAIFVASLVLVYVLHKRPLRNSILRPFPIVIIATFLSVLILFFPAYLTRLGTDSAGIIESLLISIQASIKVFKIDNPYEVFFSPLKLIDSWVKEPYLLFAIVLSMFAPLLLISFVLSFVKGIKAYASYLLGYRREVYIFSKLNEKSLVLAKSVLAHYIGQQGGGVNRRKASDANAASQDHGISQEAASGKKKKGLPLIIFTDVVVE